MSSSAAPDEPLEVRVPLAELIAAFSEPGALVEGETAQVIQTHISVVFLAGKRAWKVKKPVRLWGLVDYGTVAAREHWCREEIRLNRRMAADIYLGVVPITRTDGRLTMGGDGEVVEHAVEMIRLAAGTTMLERVEAGAVKPEEMERVGRFLAEFHAQNPLEDEAARGAPASRFGRVIQRNLRASGAGVPERFPALVHAGLVTRMARRLWRARGRLRRRVQEGRVVDGHGDIRLEHVVRFRGRTAIIDCCEFNEVLRYIDPLSDAAFLSMDLIVHGHPELAEAYERAYLEHAGEMDGAELLPLYRAYRAQVRAMVDDTSCRAPEIDEATHRRKALGALRCMALAWSQARTGAPAPLIVLRGAAGTGKSWLATRLAPWLGAEIIRSDVVRKELLGLEPTWRPDRAEKREVYGAEMHARTYAAVLVRARETVESGRAAFLDATYLQRHTRDAVHEVAREVDAPFVILDVTCDPDVVRERLLARAAQGDDASDADQEIYEEMMRSAEPIDEEEAAYTTVFESGRPAEEAILPLVEVIERQVDARRERLGPDPRPRRAPA